MMKVIGTRLYGQVPLVLKILRNSYSRLAIFFSNRLFLSDQVRLLSVEAVFMERRDQTLFKLVIMLMRILRIWQSVLTWRMRKIYYQKQIFVKVA